MNRKYQICKRCVMDTTDPDIVFDNNGICNHCKNYFEMEKKSVFKGEEGKKKLKKIVNKIKKDGKYKKYDCMLGVSGGTDSSYVTYLAKKFVLRVLLVHLDCGWNTEIATKNVENIVKKTKFDVYRYKIDWKEMKDLQLAYLKASVLNLDIPTDHAIVALLYKVADEKGIKYILDGHNVTTEGILPCSWGYSVIDLRNLKAIHKKYGTVPLKTYPTYNIVKRMYCEFFREIRFIYPLNYVDYNKKEAKKILHKEFGWNDYGGKHYESAFTKFYQVYILPTKFNIDKRKAHLSTLICSGQITREEALKELEKSLYKEEEFKREKKYILKKLGLSEKEFKDLMKLPIKKHQEYGTDEWYYVHLARVEYLCNVLLSGIRKYR